MSRDGIPMHTFRLVSENVERVQRATSGAVCVRGWGYAGGSGLSAKAEQRAVRATTLFFPVLHMHMSTQRSGVWRCVREVGGVGGVGGGGQISGYEGRQVESRVQKAHTATPHTSARDGRRVRALALLICWCGRRRACREHAVHNTVHAW